MSSPAPLQVPEDRSSSRSIAESQGPKEFEKSEHQGPQDLQSKSKSQGKDNQILPEYDISAELLNVTEDGGIKLVCPRAENCLDVSQVKSVRVLLRSSFNGAPSSAQKFFFHSNSRVVKPTNLDNNLPKAVVISLPFCALGQTSVFLVEPAYQENDFVVGYPVEKGAIVLSIEVQEVSLKKTVDSQDLNSFVRSAMISKEEGNRLFRRGLTESALKAYVSAANLLSCIPKTLTAKPAPPELIQTHVDLLNNAAQCCNMLGNFSKAVEYAEKAEGLSPNPKSKYRLFRAYSSLKDFDKAKEFSTQEDIDLLEAQKRQEEAKKGDFELKMAQALIESLKDVHLAPRTEPEDDSWLQLIDKS